MFFYFILSSSNNLEYVVANKHVLLKLIQQYTRIRIPFLPKVVFFFNIRTHINPFLYTIFSKFIDLGCVLIRSNIFFQCILFHLVARKAALFSDQTNEQSKFLTLVS
ncbi:hypothetical protein HanRHA438_Chr14g0651381 [Helianthus annuus]|nr:hypothetical protein HanRHA438_Chr14g0651381 [Helianthus annuus]